MVGLIVPWSLNAFFFAVGFLSLAGLLFIVYRLIVGPILQAQADLLSPPLTEGSVHSIVLEIDRFKSVSVGQLDSDIKTRMNGIKEDHLVLHFRRDLDLETYTITISPGGPVLFQRPHLKKYETMSGSEKIESSELIGHPALFRLVASMRSGRPVHFLEFELSTKYFINTVGLEKMRFMLTFVKFHPSLDRDSRNKRGVFNFGRMKVADEAGEGE